MSRPRIAITLGDPCGIGPELLLRSLPALAAQAELVVIEDSGHTGSPAMREAIEHAIAGFADGGRYAHTW